jgi:hypothetical protein
LAGRDDQLHQRVIPTFRQLPAPFQRVIAGPILDDNDLG